MIDIRTYRSRKKIRVDLHRRYRDIDPNTNKVKISYKQIGSFQLMPDKQFPAEFNEILHSDEIIQLKNWLAEATFADLFNVAPDELEKFIIRMPQQVFDAYARLSIEAKSVGIEFTLNQIMLESLLHKAKLVENKINKIRGVNCGILENIGIQTDKITSDEAYKRLLDVESRTLFKALLALKQPIAKTCSELEDIAHAYGKQKERIPPAQIKEWAGVSPGRNLKVVKRWCYAAAIEVLINHNMNPLQIAPPEKVTEYWALQYQSHYTLDEAKKIFNKKFTPSSALQNKLMPIIEHIYRTI